MEPDKIQIVSPDKARKRTSTKSAAKEAEKKQKFGNHQYVDALILVDGEQSQLRDDASTPELFFTVETNTSPKKTDDVGTNTTIFNWLKKPHPVNPHFIKVIEYELDKISEKKQIECVKEILTVIDKYKQQGLES